MKYKLKQKGIFWKLVSKLYKPVYTCGTTVLSTVYMPSWYFDENYNKIRKEALLIHELEHVKEWQKEGILFLIKYIFSKKKRRYYEMSAYKLQIEYLISNGVKINPDKWAEVMTGIYWIFNFITFEEAREEVSKWLEEKSDLKK